MNWKAEAIEKLQQYEAKKLALQNIPLEISRLESAMQGIRSSTADSTPVKGGGSRQEDMMLSNIVHREELERSLRQTKKWARMVEDALAALSEEERLVLDRFYICPARGNVERLCGELGCEQTTVYRKRDAALRHFTIAMYGYLEI